MKFFKKRKEIYREGGDVYLIRWNLVECRYFSIKIHRILRSDYDCLHDHPWSFVSLILWNGYLEHRDIPVSGSLYERYERTTKYMYPLTILYRKATDRHKIEIVKPATTLVVTFKKVREWGFWKGGRFIPWKEYTPGSGCE